MKAKLVLLGMVAIISLTLMACGGAESAAELKQWGISASCDNFSEQGNITKNLEVAVGDTITVTLCSNASTGFRWSEAAQIGAPALIQQVEHKFVAPEGEGLVGAPGQEVWTFKALEKGTTTIAMEYSRPWEGGEKGVWTFVLTVTVE
jgi:inhibitor of cysteine peptidase